VVERSITASTSCTHHDRGWTAAIKTESPSMIPSARRERNGRGSNAECVQGYAQRVWGGSMEFHNFGARYVRSQISCVALLNIPEASSGLTSPPRSRRTHLRDDCPGMGGTCGEDSESRRLPSPSPLPSPRTPRVKFNRPSTDEWAACTVPAASAAGF
jgi:hypothetical protein